MTKSIENAIPTIKKSYYMNDQKKQVSFQSPDINKMQVVSIDHKTKIYIAIGADPDEARSRYFDKREAKTKVVMAGRKPVVS